MGRVSSRRSVAVAALMSLALLIPPAVRASSPLTLTFYTSATTSVTYYPLNLRAIVSPIVAGLVVTFTDTTTSLSVTGITNFQGDADATMTPSRTTVEGVHHLVATFAGDGTYDPATSNTIDVNFLFGTQLSLTYGSSYADAGSSSPVYTVDQLVLHVRLLVSACDGTIHIYGSVNAFSMSAPAALVQNPGGTQSCGLDLNLGYQPVGSTRYNASYDGSLVNTNAQSPDTWMNVTLIAAATVLTVPVPQVPPGTTTPLRATVSAPHDTSYILGLGTITFFDGTTELGSAPAQSLGGVDSATIPVTFSVLGVHSLHATWSGAPDASPSTSPS